MDLGFRNHSCTVAPQPFDVPFPACRPSISLSLVRDSNEDAKKT